MENMFTAGELAKYQNISKQTLIFYDKIGLFKPSMIDSKNGYRYYSAEQLDYLDTILIMKKLGFSLNEIKEHMKNYTTENSLAFFRRQLSVIDGKINELSMLKNRLENRCEQVEKALSLKDTSPKTEFFDGVYIIYENIEQPYGMREISIAQKKCYAQSFKENIPIFFQSGVSVPLERILNERFIEASIAFLTTDNIKEVGNIKKLCLGLTACAYHVGNYYTIGDTYMKLLQYCKENSLKIISDSFEFCINDYITSRYEDEFITKIMFYVEKM